MQLSTGAMYVSDTMDCNEWMLYYHCESADSLTLTPPPFLDPIPFFSPQFSSSIPPPTNQRYTFNPFIQLRNIQHIHTLLPVTRLLLTSPFYRGYLFLTMHTISKWHTHPSTERTKIVHIQTDISTPLLYVTSIAQRQIPSLTALPRPA